MTSKILGFSLALSLAWNATAELIFYTGNASIADNDPNGFQDSRNLTGFAGVISDVNVTLSISGGFDGDLYAWISHGSGSADRSGAGASRTEPDRSWPCCCILKVAGSVQA